MWRRPRNSALVAVAVMAVGTALLRSHCDRVSACGPFFPNRVLIDADSTILSSPVAIFVAELERILPGEAPPFRASTPEGGDHAGETARAEAADLEATLAASGLAEHERLAIAARYRRFRTGLAEWAASRREPRPDGPAAPARERARATGGQPPEAPPPDPDEPLAMPGLPREFALYARGAAFHHLGDAEKARAAWEALLALAEGERRHRSVWAAYMLGRSYRGEPARAIQWFMRTRELAAGGFADSTGLAAASLGWEARAELDLGNCARAMRLYLEQHRSGDRSACASLREAARAALSAEAPHVLDEVAADPVAREVVTAFVISSHRPFWRLAEFSKRGGRWLEAVERLGAGEVRSADRLGMIAYQTGDFAAAERWLARAPEDSPVANWLRSKLFARAGRIDEAAALLARACRDFPEVETWYLYADKGSVYYDHTARPMPRAAFGELGVLELSRRHYADALDALLRGGYWLDAAFVAERVLTVEELKAYVDRRYPENVPVLAGSPHSPPEAVRYLLARRLARVGRIDEARPYYPRVTYGYNPEYPDEALLPHLDRNVRSLEVARDEGQPAPARADAFWAAATIMRQKGIELFGTEVEPDWWALYGGNFEMEPTPEHRKTSDEARFAGSSEDERERVRRSAPPFDRRWHYRYVAADLAWRAAELMPDGTDRKAAALSNAGMWIARRDPQAAERFYNALVETCGSTPLGIAAREARWFPGLAAHGGASRIDLPPAAGEGERPAALPLEDARIVVRKRERRLDLYSGGRLVRSCRIGLGSSPEGHKEREGDGRTPEGRYYVCVKNPQSRYFLSLGLSYPNEEDAARGLEAGLISREERDAIVKAIRERGIPPWQTALGGEIYIHGRGSGRDWTRGCIAVGDADMLHLFAAVPLHAPVEVAP